MNKRHTRIVAHTAVCAFIAIGQLRCASDAPGVSKQTEPKTTNTAANQSSPANLPNWRNNLLDVAFQIACDIPVTPHERDRSRMQELVAQTTLDLGMTDRAISFTQQMSGWRRGEMLCFIAQHYAALGNLDTARQYAAQALRIAEGETDWRREHVAIQIAKAYLAVGDELNIDSLVEFETQAALGQIAVAKVSSLDPANLDSQADMFDRAIATKNFDLARSGIDGYCELLKRLPDDALRHDRALKAAIAAIPGLPMDLQVTYTCQLAEILAKQGKRDLANTELDRAAAMLSSTIFLAEDVAPIGVTVARTRMKLGQQAQADTELNGLLEQFEAHRLMIVDVLRANSLRALAEAFSELNQSKGTKLALHCYLRALEEGAINPNARPRAEDLCATCASMAKFGIEPTKQVLDRIATIRASLTDPW